MKTTFKRFVSFALAAVFCLSVCFALGSCGKAPDNTIKIGMTGPLTGGASKYGIAVKNSAQLAVDEINAQGGLNGYMFSFTMLDDKHDPVEINTAYASLMSSGMQVSLGTVTTKPGLEFADLAKDDGVFFLTPSATGDDIPEHDNGYQMCFADSNQGSVAATYVNDAFVGKTVGVFYKADDPYSTGIYNQFENALDTSFTLVKASFVGDGLSFDTQIDTLKDCDLIFMPIYDQPAAAFISKAVGTVKPSAVYYGCDGLDGVEASFEDITKIPQKIIMLSHFNSFATEGPAAEFIRKYNDAYDESKEPINQFGASAYDCVWAIYRALKKATEEGKTITPTTSAAELCTILKEVFNGGFEFVGVTGEYKNGVQSTITWNASGYVNKTAVQFVIKEANS